MSRRTKRRYLGSWTLPSGNSCDVYLAREGLRLQWDRPPSHDWPPEDVVHYRAVTLPEILRAVCAGELTLDDVTPAGVGAYFSERGSDPDG